MNFIAKIKQSIEGMNLHFRYGTDEELNACISDDNTPMPAAMMYQLTDSQSIVVNSQRNERASVTIFFIDKTSFAFSSMENEDIINECKARADAWIESIFRGTDFAIIGAVNYRRIYLQYYGIYTGIGVNITLQENIGSVFCYEPETIYLLTDEDGRYIVTEEIERIQIERWPNQRQ